MKSKKLIFGLGTTGRAVADFFLKKNLTVIGVDKKYQESYLPLLERGMTYCPEDEVVSLEGVDLFILSPGISENHPLVRKALDQGIEVIGEIELALRECSRPLIGITGTNGKTTVTLLVAHVLNESGIKAEALGNIGLPLISHLEGEGIGVVELSSFQLDSAACPKLKGAILLNVTPDHLDRYPTLEDYARSKFSIQNLLEKEAPFILENQAALNYSHLIKRSAETYSFEKSPFTSSFLVQKSHDAENFIAAYLLTRQFGISEDQFIKAVSTFKKPPHRIEFVREMKGIRFWNDSKGTNVDATLRAVEMMKGPVVLIAGGVDKHFPYTSWINPFMNKVQHVVTIGEASERICRDLKGCIPTSSKESLKEALLFAHKVIGEQGDVLLSPGCASYDMFRDYADRGDQFKSLVRSLS